MDKGNVKVLKVYGVCLPCTKDCPHRTVTCKYDGSCDKYARYKEELEDAKSHSFKTDPAYIYTAELKKKQSYF